MGGGGGGLRHSESSRQQQDISVATASLTALLPREAGHPLRFLLADPVRR
jgi:hypothetical protein